MILHNDRIHAVILGLEPDISLFSVKPLDGCGVVNHRNDNVTVPSGFLFLYQKKISVVDASIDHTGSLHPQHKSRVLRHIVGRERKIAFDILRCENRNSCRHLTDKRDAGNLAPCNVKRIVHDLDCPGLCRIPPDITILLQRFQMGVDGGGRLQVYGITDLPDCRRVAAPDNLALQVIQNFLLLL